MRLAVLADVHGNLPALEAVLADARQHGADDFIVAGDFVDRPQPLETLQLLRDLGGWVIRGNREDYLLAYHTGEAPDTWRESERWFGLRWIYRRLDPEALEFIASLPEERVVDIGEAPPIRIVHASPTGPSELPLPDHDPAALDLYRKAGLFAVSYTPIALEFALAHCREPVLVCGHSHIPWKYEQEGRMVLNPGSVGAPLNGDPRAQYALLTSHSGYWQAEHRAVSYNLDRIRAAYHASGLLSAEGAYAQAMLLCIETGQNIPGRLISHFAQLARQAGFKDRRAIPEAIWEHAVATFNWETAAKGPE
jgi:predicted phosphodiesterase